MKRIALIAACALVAPVAFAADAVPAAQTAPTAAPAPESGPHAANADQARQELAEMRRQMQELSRRMATLSSQLGEGGPRSYAYRYLGDPDSAMIGVVLGMNADRVTVGALTPDGPAARAGLRGSDVITAIDHQPIEAKSAPESVDKARALLNNLKAGQKVTIDYLRDGKRGTVTFAAERREAWNWPRLMNDDPDHPFLPKDFNERVQADVERATRDAERMYQRDHERMKVQVDLATREAMHTLPRQRAMVRMAMPWWGLNLAPLNADLGRYFGTDKGVLVIAADADSLPGIHAGDVITDIAGEAVTRPEDALRALRDQDTGKDVPIKLLRDRKTLALNMKAPAFNSIFNLRATPPAPPTPAAAPTPPTPPAVPAPALPAAPATPPTPTPPPALAGAGD